MLNRLDPAIVPAVPLPKEISRELRQIGFKYSNQSLCGDIRLGARSTAVLEQCNRCSGRKMLGPLMKGASPRSSYTYIDEQRRTSDPLQKYALHICVYLMIGSRIQSTESQMKSPHSVVFEPPSEHTHTHTHTG